MKIINGKLEAFFETGTEGVIWSVYEDDKLGYEGLNCLDYGDYLRIYKDYHRTELIWEGTIFYDWEINYKPYPQNPKYGQQEVLGYWVHGVQENIDPEKWGNWFFMGLYAQLIPWNFGKFRPIKNSKIKAYHFTGELPIFNSGRAGNLVLIFDDHSYVKYQGIDQQIYKDFFESKDKYTYFKKNIETKYKQEKLLPFIPF